MRTPFPLQVKFGLFPDMAGHHSQLEMFDYNLPFKNWRTGHPQSMLEEKKFRIVIRGHLSFLGPQAEI